MLTANQLIQHLQHFAPDIPVVIRLQGYPSHQSCCPEEQQPLPTPAAFVPHVAIVTLNASDVVDTWNQDIGTVSVEISVRVAVPVSCCNSVSSLPDLRLIGGSDQHTVASDESHVLVAV